MKTEAKINGLKNRIHLLEKRDEVVNRNIINKLWRKIRALEGSSK